MRFVLKLRYLSNNEQLNFCCKLDIMSTRNGPSCSLTSSYTDRGGFHVSVMSV